MDRFVIKHIKEDQFSNACQVVCIYGPVGCGKTEWAKQNLSFIEIDESVLRSKESAMEFIDRVKHLRRNVLIDNFDGLVNSPGAQLFLKPVTKSSTILISKHWIPGTVPLELKGPDLRQKKIGFHAMDSFDDQTEIIKKHMSTPGIPRVELIQKIQSEHGNIMGIVHENAMSDSPELLHSLSDAALIDAKMYDGGEWELMPYFINSACCIPCTIINGTLGEMRPATSWTKYMNACMNAKLFKESRLTLDEADFLVRTGQAQLKFYNLKKTNGERRRKTTSKNRASGK